VFINPIIITILLIPSIKYIRKEKIKEMQLFILSLGFIIPFLIFLMRGAVIFYFYFIPVFAFFSLMTGMLPSIFDTFYSKIKKNLQGHELKRIKLISNITICCYLLLITSFSFNFNYLVSDDNKQIRDTNSWVVKNVSKDSVIITDSLYMADLYEDGYENIILYWRATSYEQVFNTTTLKGDWRNIDYFIIDQAAYDVLNSEPYKEEGVLYQALHNSQLNSTIENGPNKVYIYQVNK
jgi:hypothetical protein